MEELLTTIMSSAGLILALTGAAIAVVLGGVGSIIGVGHAGEAAAGVATEKPEIFGKLLLLQALSGTQGIYGFLAAIMILNNIGILAGEVADVSIGAGAALLIASLPVAFAGLFSAIFQGRVAISGMNLTAKNTGDMGKGVIMAAMVETYAVLGLLVTILLLNGISL